MLPELSGAVCLGDERLLPTRLGSVNPRRRALAGVARLAGEQALVGADVASAFDSRSRSGRTSALRRTGAPAAAGSDACSRPNAGASPWLLLVSNTSSEGVAAGHSAAPRRLQETGVSTR